MANKAKSKQTKYVDLNPVESLLSIGKGVGDSFTDIASDSASDMWKQILGGELTGGKSSGELHEGQELDVKALVDKKHSEKKAHVEPGIHYTQEIIHAEKKISHEKEQHMSVQIEQIMHELKQLIAKSTELEVEFRSVTVEDKPVKVGVYHETFFVWLLAVVRSARMRVEDSANWLQLFQSKKKKQSYWNMFKKHGTTFGLSNERNVSTQTG